MKNSGTKKSAKIAKVAKTQKFKTFFTQNYKLLILLCGLTLLNLFFLFWSAHTRGLAFSSKTFLLLLAGSILLEIILCVILFVAKHKSWKIEKTFLVLGLIVGVLYVFALPVGRAPDEESHFFRIYEITQGHIISDTAPDSPSRGSLEASNLEIVRDFKVNNTTYVDTINHLGDYPDNNDQTFVVTSAGSYNPIDYTPHLLGMALGQALRLPFLVTAYIAKLFNCIACILILYFCIKYIPILKEFIFFVAFLPITMQAMTSLSADGFITVVAIALTSFVIYSLYARKTPFTKKHYALMLALCLVLSLSKIVYAFVCFLLFAIPKERFKTQKTKLIAIFSIGGICAVTLLAWLILSASLGGEIDPTNQNLLLSHPLKYLAILIHSLSVNFSIYLGGTLGGYLEWFNVVLSPLYLFPSLIIFVLLCQKAREQLTTTKSLRFLAIAIFGIIALLTFTAMFTQWTKPGETVIDGVQGRYFLPLALLIPLAFLPISQKLPRLTTHLKQNYALYGFFIFESVYAITSIMCTHV